jgi:hypothetical protein
LHNSRDNPISSHIVADARNLLNFDQPIAFILSGILGHIEDLDEACDIVEDLMGAVVPGSYLVIRDSTNTSDAFVRACEHYAKTGAVPYHPRGPEQLARFHSPRSTIGRTSDRPRAGCGIRSISSHGRAVAGCVVRRR